MLSEYVTLRAEVVLVLNGSWLLSLSIALCRFLQVRLSSWQVRIVLRFSARCLSPRAPEVNSEVQQFLMELIVA